MQSRRNFLHRAEYERRRIVDNTSPQEYEEDRRIFVEGTCNECDRIVRSEIVKKDVG